MSAHYNVRHPSIFLGSVISNIYKLFDNSLGMAQTLVMRYKLTGDSPLPAEFAGLVELPSLHLQCMQTAPALAL